MLIKYMQKALELAHYEIIKDEEPYYGEIRELPGVWATGTSLEECRQNLSESLEDWLLISIARHMPVPELEGIEFEMPKESAIAD